MTTIKLRRGTAAQWTSADPILAQGEPGFETDTNKHKIGDGVTHWSLLKYFVDEIHVADAIAVEGMARDAAIIDAVNGLVNGAPGALNTLKELSDQFSSDETAAGALTNLVSNIRGLTDSTHNTALTGAFVQHLRSRGWKFLTDYSGADPTGATDSTAALNAMILDINNVGGHGFIPPGIWAVSVAAGLGGDQYMVQARPGVTLVGGLGSTIRVANGQPNYKAIIGHDPSIAIDNFVLDGVQFDMNATGNPVSNVNQVIGNGLQRSAFRTDKCAHPTVKNCRFTDIDSTTVVAIENATWGAVVDENEFEWTHTPLVDHDSSTIYCASQSSTIAGIMQITNNIMVGYASSGFNGARTAIETHGPRQIITGNQTVDYSKAVNVTGVSTVDSNDILISNNVFSGIKFGVVLWSLYYSTKVTGYQLRNVRITNNTMTMDVDKWGAHGYFIGKNSSDNSGMQNIDISNNTFRMLPPVTYVHTVSSSVAFCLYFPQTMRSNLYTTTVTNDGANGHAQITDPNAGFNSGDVNAWVMVQGAGTDMEPVCKTANALHAQIESVQSSTVVTLTKAATTLFSSGAPTSAIVGYTKSTNVHINNNTFDGHIGGGIRYLLPTVGLEICGNKFRNLGQGGTVQNASYRTGVFIAAPLSATKIDNNEFVDDRTTALMSTAVINIATSIGNYRGLWTTGTAYVPGDVVLSGNTAYMTSQTFTSGANFAADGAKWYLYPGSTSDCQAMDNRLMIFDSAAVSTVKTFSSDQMRPFTIRHRVQQYITPTANHPFGYGSEIIDPVGGKIMFQADAPRGSNWIQRIISLSSTTVAPQIDDFTVSGTWTKPTGAVRVQAIVIAGGAGGGSARRGAAGSIRCAGAGGGAGMVAVGWFSAAELGATETVTVGTGGAGGAAVTTDNTDGNAGTVGLASNFGTASTPWIRSTPGTGGSGGTVSTSTAGGAGGPGGAAGSAGSTTGLVGTTANGATTRGTFTTAGGGASGGGLTAANAESAGGTGSPGGSGSNGGGAAGTAGGGAGVAGTAARTAAGGGGGSGGGSSANGTTPGGDGGAGAYYGGGGGGGGASTNGANSGKGGDGANGFVRVITYFQ